MTKNRITKITRHGNGDLEVVYDGLSPVGGTQSMGVRSADAPNPRFPAALQSLKHRLVDIADLPGEWSQGLSIAGVRVKWIPDPGFEPTAANPFPPLVPSVTIIGEKVIGGYERPLKVTLPATVFGAPALMDIEDLFDLALRFAAGDRAQTTIEFEDPLDAALRRSVERTNARGN